jgi:uncharacterized membrane protein SpoIIM required for sporulation
MKQRLFEQQHGPFWQRFAACLTHLEQRRDPADTVATADFPTAYRQLCQHLAIARQRQYSASLIEHLNQLALRGYQQLYQTRPGYRTALSEFIAAGFPRLVRQQAALVWLSAGLFYLPALVLAWAVYQQPELIYSLLDHASVAEFEQMYRSGQPATDRPADSDVLMLGYYIYNNISIGFQCFAGGLMFGIGALFTTLLNGVFLGMVAGYLTAQGYGDTFYAFVIGHGAFELTGIVLAGAAGLKLGLALIAPGRYTRLAALRRAAAISVQLIYGVVMLLLVAAVIEAFWSANRALPATVKYSVGAGGWLAVLLYLLLAGRRAT